MGVGHDAHDLEGVRTDRPAGVPMASNRIPACEEASRHRLVDDGGVASGVVRWTEEPPPREREAHAS